MVEIASGSLPHIQAALNYLAATGEKPVTYAYQPPPGVPWSTAEIEEHATVIHDLRPAASEFLLDDVGFQLLTHRSAVKNFWDEEDIKRVYYPESIDLLKRVTGASEVRIFDHTLRRRMPGENDRSTKPGVPRQPANRVHVDQTATSGASRLRLDYPDEADELLRRRVAIVNLWRPIKSPALDAPLAVCDARSVAPRTSSPPILSFATGAARLTISSTIRANAGSMRRQCARTKSCCIKCFNSRDDGVVSRFAPHTAFVDPTAPRGRAAAREHRTAHLPYFRRGRKARH